MTPDTAGTSKSKFFVRPRVNRDEWMDGWMDGWMDEQNHSERMTKQRKENVVCVYEEGRGGGILT